MSYSEFTLESACHAFSLDLNDQADLFAAIPPVAISAFLRETLDENVPLATSNHTEKARSEFIVAPILGAIRRIMKHRISLFSGVEFNVDASRGLTGVCDFILSASPVQLIMRCPVMAVVEAINDNIKGGLGQCIAAMVASKFLNEREHEEPTIIHGAVTTGSLWTFLKLENATIFVDRIEYHVDHVEKVLAILLHCVGGNPASTDVAA